MSYLLDYIRARERMNLVVQRDGLIREKDELRSQLDKANDMVVYLMKMLPWGAATGALYEDPVVKAAIRSVEARRGVKS